MNPDQRETHRLAPGWIVVRGAGLTAVRSPDGDVWDLETGSAEPPQVLASLAGLGAVLDPAGNGDTAALSEPDPPGEDPLAAAHDLVLYPSAPDHVESAFAGLGFVSREISETTSDPVVLVTDSSLSAFSLEINSRIVLGTSARVLPITISGATVTVGPLVDPDRGGPCLRCIRERSAAAFIEAVSWPREHAIDDITIGVLPPRRASAHLAAILATDWLARIQGAFEASMLTHMNRVTLDTWVFEEIPMYPLPWCVDCGPSAADEATLVSFA